MRVTQSGQGGGLVLEPRTALDIGVPDAAAKCRTYTFRLPAKTSSQRCHKNWYSSQAGSDHHKQTYHRENKSCTKCQGTKELYFLPKNFGQTIWSTVTHSTIEDEVWLYSTLPRRAPPAPTWNRLGLRWSRTSVQREWHPWRSRSSTCTWGVRPPMNLRG